MRIRVVFGADESATQYVHYAGAETRLDGIRIWQDGDPYDLGSLPGQLYAGIEDLHGTAYHEWTLNALNSPTGVVSGAIPSTSGISWTGPSLMRLFASGDPRTFYGDAILVDVRDPGSNFVP